MVLPNFIPALCPPPCKVTIALACSAITPQSSTLLSIPVFSSWSPGLGDIFLVPLCHQHEGSPWCSGEGLSNFRRLAPQVPHGHPFPSRQCSLYSFATLQSTLRFSIGLARLVSLVFQGAYLFYLAKSLNLVSTCTWCSFKVTGLNTLHQTEMTPRGSLKAVGRSRAKCKT